MRKGVNPGRGAPPLLREGNSLYKIYPHILRTIIDSYRNEEFKLFLR